MSVRSGALRDKLKIYRLGQTSTGSRLGGKTIASTVHKTRRCSIEPLNGKEYFKSGADQTKVTHRIRFRYEADLLRAGDRLVDERQSPAVTYEVMGPPINAGNENRELVVMCEVRGRE